MRCFRLALVLGAVIFTSWSTTDAKAQTGLSSSEPASGAVVCAPGVYHINPADCLPLGPSPYLAAMAGSGLTIPQSALPAQRPDPMLGDIPYRYFHVISEDPVPVGSAPGDSGGEAFLPGFVYVSYDDRVDTGRGIYYRMQSGGWVPGKGESVGEIPSFQGLTFRLAPRSAFGWAFEDIPVAGRPGHSDTGTGRRLLPLSVVPIYDTQQSEGSEWNLVGPGAWVEARKIAQVTVNSIPPEGSNDTRRWIEVNLAEQTLAAYENRRLVFATMVASGVEPFWTRPGLFQIYRKTDSEVMRNNNPADFYYLENVPWIMYFDGPRALHGAYWRTRFGYPQSHGCVNLSLGDSHWLFNWAHEGDWVFVHDPTGRTPTDPALYTGAAY